MSELTDNAIAMLRICVHDGTENTAQVYFAQLLNQISAIEEVRDDWYRAWKQEQAARSLADDEVERLRARLALAESVMRNLAKVLCSPRYDRGDGCGDEEKMLANFGWTKEDTE